MSPQIARIEPYLISDGESGEWHVRFGTGLILSAGDLELLVEEPLDISQTLGQLLSGTRELSHRRLPDEVITFICEEGVRFMAEWGVLL